MTARRPAWRAIMTALVLLGAADCTNLTDVSRRVAQLEVVSGGGQTAATGATLPLPVRVRAVNFSGNSIAGLVVRFEPEAGSGSVSPTVSTTDGDGIASTQWTLGAQPGLVTLGARIVDPGNGGVAPGPGPSTVSTEIRATAQGVSP